MTTTSEVLAGVLRERDISQTQLAKAIGVTPQAVQQWCSGKTTPRGMSLAKLADYLKLSPAVIQYGPQADSTPAKQTVVETEDGFVCIPQFDVSGSCGTGFDNGSLALRAIVGLVKVTVEWLISKCPGVNWRRLEVITASGSSMSPTIGNLDFVFVDRSYTAVRGDGIYVLTYCGDTYIKRVQRQPNGGLLLISDNPIYPPISIPAEELDTVTVEGRCVIYCKAGSLM